MIDDEMQGFEIGQRGLRIPGFWKKTLENLMDLLVKIASEKNLKFEGS